VTFNQFKYRRDRAAVGVHFRTLAKAAEKRRLNSPNHESLFVQEHSVRGPELDPPFSRTSAVHGVPTVGAVPVALIGSNTQIDRLKQAPAAIPPMLNRCVARRLEARVKDERT
jgi:hypothetical protein